MLIAMPLLSNISDHELLIYRLHNVSKTFNIVVVKRCYTSCLLDIVRG